MLETCAMLGVCLSLWMCSVHSGSVPRSLISKGVKIPPALFTCERKAFGKHIDASRLFLYKVTRNLLHAKGDTGAYLRTTMGALVLFGVPPEEYWPYTAQDPY